MKKTPTSILLACVLLIAAIWVGWHSFSSNASSISQKPETHLETHRPTAPAVKPAPLSVPKAALSPASPEAAAAIAQAREAAIDQMHDAATTYDKAQLPVIQPYLVDPDPELRAAAADCMIILGDASAGPMLREAAKKMDSAEEAKDLEKKADYVELPPIDIKKASKLFKNGGIKALAPQK
ncbi:MAG: HEAT repeat domain-containing protein [Luteolibacter sp.]